MYNNEKIWIGFNEEGQQSVIYPAMANRHGLIAGATGTGKTVTLKVMAESFSSAGVPVFLADVKGDLSGMCNPGTASETVAKRLEAMGMNDEGFPFVSYPVNYWDVYGEKGMPLRTTISEMGPLLLAKIMGLNDIQSDILTMIFKIADDEGLLLIDTKDLRSMIQYVGEHAKEYTLNYGNISKQSLGAISRALVAMEAEGAEQFFGEPALDIKDWLAADYTGKGTIQVLDCQKLIQNPTMYATFLLWMMSELFEVLPEAGDLKKPRIVFFFDEAHMLFENASKALLTKIEQVVKLIRSKGVGIYFITQTPSDIPDGVLSQLGNKVQHALRAYTPADQKAVKAAARSFRENPAFDTYETLQQLGVGEALISVLDEQGIPTVVERCTILPPQSQMGPITDEQRASVINNSNLYVKYLEEVDRDSAYEFLQRQMQAEAEEAETAAAQAKEQKEKEKAEAEALKKKEKEEAAKKKEEERKAKKKQNEFAKVAGSAAGTIGREVGKDIGKKFGTLGKKVGGNVGAQLGRTIFGTLLKK